MDTSKDMTSGKELNLIIAFMLPLFFGNIFQQCYNIMDSMIVGKYESATALGAIGCTSAVTTFVFCFCHGLATGAGVIVSQLYGGNKKGEIQKTIANSFYLLLGVGLFISITCMLFARPILVFLHTPKLQLELAVQYMKIICGGMITVAIYNHVAQIMRALGDSKTPLYFLILSSIINIVLDVLFVVHFKWGVIGAATATVISQAVAAVGSLLYVFIHNPYFKFRRESLRYDTATIRNCLRLGMPLAAQMVMISISCIFLQRVVNAFDVVVVSAFTITSKVELFVDQFFISLGSALTTFTGQNLGAGNVERVKVAFHKCAMIAIVTCILIIIGGLFGSKVIVSFFVSDKEVILVGTKALQILSLMYLPLGMIFITRGVLNGAGDATFSFINGIIEVISRIAFSLIFVYVIPIGMWAVWIATGLTWLFTAATALLRYQFGPWKTRKI